ncbi:MAG: cytochrome-c peroxidase, partial [Crocinitomicaceae bacterium]
NCNACHTAPLFMSNQFVSNGLPIDSTLKDLGRFAITLNPRDSFAFKVPTLRNIEYTFPYMHDGRFNKLSEVLTFYNSEVELSNTPHEESLDMIDLNSDEQKDIIAFLKTLTDRTFLYDSRFSFPRN